MRRMYTENQIISLVQQFAPHATPEEIQSMFDDNEISLAGKYVRIMPAPTSTTLSDEQIEQIIGGVFIDGNFLGFKNPVLFPAGEPSGYDIYSGFIMSQSGTYNSAMLQIYKISKITKKIELYDTGAFSLGYDQANQKTIFKNRKVPSFPANTGTFILKYINGELTWVEEI